jgi:hypothetical protein
MIELKTTGKKARKLSKKKPKIEKLQEIPGGTLQKEKSQELNFTEISEQRHMALLVAKQSSHWTDIPIQLQLRMDRKALKDHHQIVGPHHNGQIYDNGSFIPIASRLLTNFLFSSLRRARRTLLPTENLKPAELVIVYSDHCNQIVHPSVVSEIIVPQLYFPSVYVRQAHQLRNLSQRSFSI